MAKKKIDEVAIENEINEVAGKIDRKIKEPGAKLRKLLNKEYEALKTKEKTRGAEMLAIFAAHNYYANGFTPVEMRTTLEDLGPTYVKIGQIMSSRLDLLPESYCSELEKLRQNVKPLDAAVARAVIEEETGKNIEELYSEFRDEPLGSASIGQVHYGVLKDGTRVVTKVQRPLIADMMARDFVLLKKLASLVNVVSEGSDSNQLVDLLSVIEELEKVTNEELDFRVEAEHTKFFKENCVTDETKVTCPTVIDELTTSKIFTMTFVDGYTISHKDRIIADGYDVYTICHDVIENFVDQVFDHGIFHGDPHQGNIMVSHGVPYWIDFGMIGRVTDRDIDNITTIIMSLLTGDTEGVVDGVLAMGAATGSVNRDKIVEDAQPFMDMVNGAASINDIDLGEIVDGVSDLAARHHISLPGQYTMLARSVITIEGVIEELCPELNILELMSEKITARVRENFSIEKTLMDFGKDMINVSKKASKLPSTIVELISNIAKGKLKTNIEITGLDEPLDRIGYFLKYTVLVLIGCVLFLGSCMLAQVDIQPKTPNGMPLLSVVGIVFSISLTIFAVGKLFKE